MIWITHDNSWKLCLLCNYQPVKSSNKKNICAFPSNIPVWLCSPSVWMTLLGSKSRHCTTFGTTVVILKQYGTFITCGVFDVSWRIVWEWWTFISSLDHQFPMFPDPKWSAKDRNTVRVVRTNLLKVGSSWQRWSEGRTFVMFCHFNICQVHKDIHWTC